jgi:hypothetical protein
MPTSAILVTYKDMEPKVLREFITKARAKYGTALANSILMIPRCG